MAGKAKPAGKGRGAGKDLKDQINGLDPDMVREFFDKIHEISDEAEETAAASRGEIGRVYDKACEKLDVSKDALTFVFKEERKQRKAAAKAAKMDTRARDSLERLGASLGDTPMGKWATGMASLAGSQSGTEA
jgi:septation ring formation regulator EzrA